MLNQKLATIQAIGKIEEYLTDISNLKEALAGVSLWRPAAALLKQCDEATRMISKMAARMERKLVVTLIGPSGSGKSTLLNALAGRDDLSPVSNRRPTTQNVVAFCQQIEDTDQLMAQLGPENVILHCALEVQRLENLIIIDTPDTDSTHQERHIPIIEKAVLFSDVLLCVFDAENPKRRDHADFMAGQVQSFNGDSLVVLLNKCDRLDGRELSEKILPDFEAFLKTVWNKPLTRILCTSGRSHLKNPKWDPKALPRNDLDQFKILQQLLFETFSRPGFSIDRRLENARTIRDYIVSKVNSAAKKDAEDLSHLLIRMKESEQSALKQALQTLGNDEERQILGINVMLYQKLAQRWLGPVGWLVALWGRILVFGLGFTAMLRFGNPVRQIWGMAATLRHYKEAKGAMDISQQGEDLEEALSDYKAVLMQSWPDIAEALVALHVDNKVRDVVEILPDSKQLGENLSQLWQQAVQLEVQKSADSLSHFFLQILFNLPAVGSLGYTGWLTATHFFSGHYLSSDFFVHALLTILFALLLSFFLLQVIIRMVAGRNRIHRRAFYTIQKRLKNFSSLSKSSLARQLAVVIGLGQKK
jgi:GTPase SAR1 family protein